MVNSILPESGDEGYMIRNDGLRKKRYFGEKNKKCSPLKIEAVFLDNVRKSWDTGNEFYLKKVFHPRPNSDADFQENWPMAMHGRNKRWKFVACTIDRMFRFRLIFMDMNSDDPIITNEIVVGESSNYKAITLCLSSDTMKSEIDYSWGSQYPIAYISEFNNRGAERHLVIKPSEDK